MSTTNILLALAIALAMLLMIPLADRFHNRPSRAARVRRRGLEYALAEVFEAVDKEACRRRLRSEAENGLDMDNAPSSFDEAILEVLDRSPGRAGYNQALSDVSDCLERMVARGEHSEAEASAGFNAVDRLMNHESESGFFIVEYLRLERGQPVLERRPFAEWPLWADGVIANLDRSQ